MPQNEAAQSEIQESQNFLERINSLSGHVIDYVQAGFDHLTSSRAALAATGALALGGTGIAETVFDASPATAAQYETRVIHKASNLSPTTVTNGLEMALPWGNYKLAVTKGMFRTKAIPPESSYLYPSSGGFKTDCSIMGNNGSLSAFLYFNLAQNGLASKGCPNNAPVTLPPSNEWKTTKGEFQRKLNVWGGKIANSVGIRLEGQSTAKSYSNDEQSVAVYNLQKQAVLTGSHTSNVSIGWELKKIVLEKEYRIVDGAKQAYTEGIITQEKLLT